MIGMEGIEGPWWRKVEPERLPENRQQCNIDHGLEMSDTAVMYASLPGRFRGGAPLGKLWIMSQTDCASKACCAAFSAFSTVNVHCTQNGKHQLHTENAKHVGAHLSHDHDDRV